MEQEKKAYAPPTLVEHGKVEEETKGFCTYNWESYGAQQPPPEPGKGGN